MKRIIALTTATLMVSSALAAPAFANDMKKGTDADTNAQMEMDSGTTAGAGAETGTNAGSGTMDSGSSSMSGTADSGVDTGTTASTDTQASLESAMSAVKDGTATSTIKGMSEVSQVNVVEVGTMASNQSSADIDSTVEENQTSIDDLHAAIESNSAVKSKLDEQQVDVSNVVAAQTQADGSLTVYVR